VIIFIIQQYSQYYSSMYFNQEILDEPVPMEVDEDSSIPEVISVKPIRKCIPAPLRRKVWNTYMGEECGKGKCICCDDIVITPFMFECGHVISDHHGGTLSIENLRPICCICNRSMGKQNMEIYMMVTFSRILSDIKPKI
jgi:hypothetical protein